MIYDLLPQSVLKKILTGFKDAATFYSTSKQSLFVFLEK